MVFVLSCLMAMSSECIVRLVTILPIDLVDVRSRTEDIVPMIDLSVRFVHLFEGDMLY